MSLAIHLDTGMQQFQPVPQVRPQRKLKGLDREVRGAFEPEANGERPESHFALNYG